MKKTISGLLALLLLLSVCVGCGNNDPAPDQAGAPDQTGQNQADAPDASAPAREGQMYTNLLGIDPSETALEVDGNAIPAELYLYWLTTACDTLEYNLNMAYYSATMYGDTANAGVYAQMINEDGAAKWDAELDGAPLGQLVKEQAKSNALSYIVLENEAAARNITLTDEDRTALESFRDSYIQQLGGQEAFDNNLWEMGISLESFDRVNAVSLLYQHLLELAQDPESDLYQAPAGTEAYVDHILLMTVDAETREPLSEEEAAAKKEKAEELLAQLQEAPAEELEGLFTQLADVNSEDSGRETYPNGYFFGPGEMVQAFEDAAFALQPGEISGIVETEYGYHILLRKDLTEEHLAAIAEQNLGSYLDGKLEEMMEKMVFSEKLADIDVGSFYADYVQAVKALHPELNAESEPEEGAGGETGGADGSGAEPTEVDE